ncbi:MAG: ribbon-helix-helix domain-containing protein [Candidatus Micrarchaeota archaeon]
MVEVVIFKVPDGTKDVLKALANKRGYMGLSDFLRDLVRHELQEEKKAFAEQPAGATPAESVESMETRANVPELGAP